METLLHILSPSSLNVESSYVQCRDFLSSLLESLKKDLGVATLLLNVVTLLQPCNQLPSFATVMDVMTSSVECCDFSFQCRDLGHGLLVLSMLLENPSKSVHKEFVSFSSWLISKDFLPIRNENLFLFQKISWSVAEVIKTSSSWARQYESCTDVNKRNHHKLPPTTILDNSSVFLCTNGAVARNSGCAAIGVARDHDRNWIVSFFRFLGVCSLFEAEVWGIPNGIFLLLNRGFRKISISTDNLEVIQALLVLNSKDTGISALRRAHRIMRAEGQWHINHIPRNQNLVMDCLRKLSLNWRSSLQIFGVAPKEVLDLLHIDKDNSNVM
ncbi:hypothetical protein J1N35_025824 [Gossypium stocksii]|uniref:RNase H type-1 domain-containing protein n=1 Tax=Gossypium stocksii TaxID=47602 RepID=A0A9D3V716_9ROSI|nr:hypothetical protein J1N35_025824 [Gossypium stocksii]